MSRSDRQIDNHVNISPTVDYSKRRPLFPRTTTWSLRDESSPDFSVPCDSVMRSDKPVFNSNQPVIELTLGDVEIPESFTQTKDIETGIVRKVLSSITPALSIEDVIVQNVQVESSAVHVLTKPLSSVAQPVIYSNSTHRTLSIDEGDNRETRNASKPLLERSKNSGLKHGDYHKRGHSLSELPTAVRRNMLAQQQHTHGNKFSHFQRFSKSWYPGERKTFRTPPAIGTQSCMEKLDPVLLLPIEVKAIQVESRLNNETKSTPVPSPIETSAIEQNVTRHPEDVCSTSTDLIKFGPFKHLKTGRSSKELPRSTRNTVVDLAESRRASASEGNQTEMRTGRFFVGGDRHERPYSSCSKGTDVEERYAYVLSKLDLHLDPEIKQIDERFCNKAVQTDFPLKGKQSVQSQASLSHMRYATSARKPERFRSPSPYVCQTYRCLCCNQLAERTTRSVRSMSGRRTAEQPHRSRQVSQRAAATTTSMRNVLSPEIGHQRSSKRATSCKSRRKWIK